MNHKKTIRIALALFASLGAAQFQRPTPALAHEGHDHTPGAVQAPHGGLLQGTNSLYLELVQDSSGLKLYPLTREMKPIALKEIQVAANVQFPKEKTKKPLKLSGAEDHLEGQVDTTKGTYRYVLELQTEYQGKKEKLQFQIEPQS